MKCIIYGSKLKFEVWGAAEDAGPVVTVANHCGSCDFCSVAKGFFSQCLSCFVGL